MSKFHDRKLFLFHLFGCSSLWFSRTTVSCIWSSEPPAPRRFETVIKRAPALFRAASPFYVVFPHTKWADVGINYLPVRHSGILNACFALSSSSEVSISGKMCWWCFPPPDMEQIKSSAPQLCLFIILCLLLSYSQRDNERKVSEHSGEAWEVSGRKIPNTTSIPRFSHCPLESVDFDSTHTTAWWWFSHLRKIVYTFLPKCLCRATCLLFRIYFNFYYWPFC